MSSCSPSELVNVELPYMGYAITSAGVGRGLPLDKAEIREEPSHRLFASPASLQIA
jgi:hypothetical protein